MKKLSFLMCCMVLVFAMTACGGKSDETSKLAGPDGSLKVENNIKPETPDVTEDNGDVQDGLQEDDVPEEETGLSYADFMGTWYMHEYEIEGEHGTCIDEELDYRVTFYEDYVAEFYRNSPGIETMEGYTMEGSCSFNVVDGVAYVSVNDAEDDCEHLFSIDAEGNLIDDITIIYDGSYMVGATHIYTREAIDFSYLFPETPPFAQEYIDNAAENAWITVLHDFGPMVDAECDEYNWKLETAENYLDVWENPKELIIINSGDRDVEIEIHTADYNYVTTQSDTEWVAGPFMYYAYLNPGELYRVIVDMPDEPRDATLAMYMTYAGEDASYYIRIYGYSMEDPYIYF